MFPPITDISEKRINSSTEKKEKQSSNDLLTLQRFDKLLPMIGSQIRETKSSGAKQALMKLAVNSKLLFFEIAAIRIQCIYRQHLAKERVKLIKHHVKLFLRITEDFQLRVVEEIVLSMGLEISLNIIKSHLRYKTLKQIVDNEMQFIIEEMIEKEVLEVCNSVVVETITEATDYIALRRPQQAAPPKYNLVLDLISILSNEVTDSYMRAIAIEAIQEEVQEYLLHTYSLYIFEWLANDVIFELTKESLANEIMRSEQYHNAVIRRNGDKSSGSINGDGGSSSSGGGNIGNNNSSTTNIVTTINNNSGNTGSKIAPSSGDIVNNIINMVNILRHNSGHNRRGSVYDNIRRSSTFSDTSMPNSLHTSSSIVSDNSNKLSIEIDTGTENATTRTNANVSNGSSNSQTHKHDTAMLLSSNSDNAQNTDDNRNTSDHTDPYSDEIHFPIHTFRQAQLLHGIVNYKIPNVMKFEIDKVISSMPFMTVKSHTRRANKGNSDAVV